LDVSNVSQGALEGKPDLKVPPTLDERRLPTYKLYLQKLKSGFAKYKDLSSNRPHYKGVYLTKMAERAMEDANKESSHKALKNLWN